MLSLEAQDNYKEGIEDLSVSQYKMQVGEDCNSLAEYEGFPEKGLKSIEARECWRSIFTSHNMLNN